jgi:two-component system OmpR family response regulator
MIDRESADRLEEGDRLHILVVDDEEAIVELLLDFVSDLGYIPYSAPNGQQALALAFEHWPVLVITDFMMPKMNGADLIRSLYAEAKAHKRARPPIILLTAAGVPALKDLHVDVVMTKPFDLDQLETAIRRLLRATAS